MQKILIVEDDLDIQELLQEFLQPPFKKLMLQTLIFMRWIYPLESVLIQGKSVAVL